MTIVVMNNPRSPYRHFIGFRLISQWKYTLRSGSYLVGQGLRLTECSVATIMVPNWLETNMPTTLTLKNIPDGVYLRLKASAEVHRRSMNSEAIVRLEAALLPIKITPAERLVRARALRESLPRGKFLVRDIDTLKRAGRP
jgi:antitoxin FitA